MKNKKLLKRGLILAFLLIIFFSFKTSYNASNFKYSDFDWDELVAQNKDYWVSGCHEDEECVDRLLKTKKKFYTRMYELLAEFQRRGFTINDNIIIETVFFGLTPDSFADENSRDPVYEGYIYENAYKVDESEKKSKYILGDDGDKPGAQEYFRIEEDSLKTLLNNMVGYIQDCYGVSSETPYSATNSDGSSYYTCDGEGVALDGKCVVKIKPLTTNFFDSIGLFFFGRTSKNKKLCASAAEEYGYAESYLGEASSRKMVNEDIYWDFLANYPYFDNKFQLNDYFSTILAKTHHKQMSELSDDEYNEYDEEIVEVRKRIIDNIKTFLDRYDNYSELYKTMTSSSQNYYWWPIGSDEVTTDGIVNMASGEASSTNITSGYGKRVTPKVGMHYGVDISGTVGVTNVIAAMDGVVVYSSLTSEDNCADNSDLNDSCGGGYGNHIILQHSDGNYTLYAHLAQNSIVVNNGDSVVQGQVIGKVGSSGSSTGGHLHFEVRQGGNTSSNSIDPLTFISNTNTRASGSSSSLIEFLHSWEGTPKESGSDYVAFDDGYGNVTIGWGVVPVYNKDRFLALGVNPDGISVGSTVSKAVVDQIEQQEIQSAYDSIRSMLSTDGITLEEYQIDALVSRKYNYNVKGFADAYKKYGNNQTLYDNYMSKPVTSKGKHSDGLVRRREAEWALFNTGNYQHN